MPICRRSASSVAATTAALASLLGLAMPVDAQGAPTAVDAAQHDPSNSDAPTAIDNSATAMERLRGAIARGKDSPPIAGPADIPKPPDALRRRAFEAMRARAPSPAMDARARTGLKAGEKGLAAELLHLASHGLWYRRWSTKSNGVSYPVQRAAEALYSPEGREQIRNLIDHYMGNAKILREGCRAIGLDD